MRIYDMMVLFPKVVNHRKLSRILFRVHFGFLSAIMMLFTVPKIVFVIQAIG